ncbi:hypothetical protein [Halorientalis persicus]|uniref:hypothetical protein n=1 Tax=Halorientalis persicus TaxID=1367881 RepID=UPI0014813A82|nr:hypothetical protein [Halorientalis persicus]
MEQAQHEDAHEQDVCGWSPLEKTSARIAASSVIAQLVVRSIRFCSVFVRSNSPR